MEVGGSTGSEETEADEAKLDETLTAKEGQTVGLGSGSMESGVWEPVLGVPMEEGDTLDSPWLAAAYRDSRDHTTIRDPLVEEAVKHFGPMSMVPSGICLFHDEGRDALAEADFRPRTFQPVRDTHHLWSSIDSYNRRGHTGMASFKEGKKWNLSVFWPFLEHRSSLRETGEHPLKMFLDTAAEWCFALETGIPLQESPCGPNLFLLQSGKLAAAIGCSSEHTPVLRVRKDQNTWPDIFILLIISQKNQEAHIHGWCNSTDVQSTDTWQTEGIDYHVLTHMNQAGE